MKKIPYLVKVNGKRASNGKTFGLTIEGSAVATDDTPEHDLSCMDCLEELAAHIEGMIKEERMEIIEGLQVTIGKPVDVPA